VAENFVDLHKRNFSQPENCTRHTINTYVISEENRD